jgi:hypothetical protein
MLGIIRQPLDAAAIQSELTRQLRSRGWKISSLQVYGGPATVADSASKYLALDARGRRLGFVLCSSPIRPELVAQDLRKARQARRLLGAYGRVVIEPLVRGSLDGLSYALLPYCRPFSTSRLLWPAHRLFVGAAMLQWLRAAARQSRVAPTSDQIEHAFVEPLKRLASHPLLPRSVIEDSRRALQRLESGEWVPVHSLTHGDLWRGNILRAPGTWDWSQFVIIDWGGSNVRGHGFFDLIRLAESYRIAGRRLRAEVGAHCRIQGCKLADARSYLLAALGCIGMDLHFFPPDRFADMAIRCIAILDRLGVHWETSE